MTGLPRQQSTEESVFYLTPSTRVIHMRQWSTEESVFYPTPSTRVTDVTIAGFDKGTGNTNSGPHDWATQQLGHPLGHPSPKNSSGCKCVCGHAKRILSAHLYTTNEERPNPGNSSFLEVPKRGEFKTQLWDYPAVSPNLSPLWPL